MKKFRKEIKKLALQDVKIQDVEEYYNYKSTGGRLDKKPSQGFRPLSNIKNLYVKTIDEYRGDTLSEKIYNYLSEVIKVPTEQYDFIIEYLK